MKESLSRPEPCRDNRSIVTFCPRVARPPGFRDSPRRRSVLALRQRQAAGAAARPAGAGTCTRYTGVTSAGSGLLRALFLVVRDPDGAEAQLGREAGAVIVRSPRAGEGLAMSLRAGLERVASTAPATGAAALVVLGDQPAIRRDVIDEVVRRWRDHRRRSGASPIRRAPRTNRVTPSCWIGSSGQAVPLLEGDTGPGQAPARPFRRAGRCTRPES